MADFGRGQGGMGDGHGSWEYSQRVVCFMGNLQFLALLRYPVSGVRLRTPVSGALRLIMNCGRIVDFGWGGVGDLYRNFWRLYIGERAGYRKFPPSAAQE